MRFTLLTQGTRNSCALTVQQYKLPHYLHAEKTDYNKLKRGIEAHFLEIYGGFHLELYFFFPRAF